MGDELRLPIRTKAKILRPVSDGNFETIQLSNNLTRSVRIGVVLPIVVKEKLKRCLRVNIDLFITYPYEMMRINPSVVCHQLNIDIDNIYVL